MNQELENTSSLIHPDIVRSWGSGELSVSPAGSTTSPNGASGQFETKDACFYPHDKSLLKTKDACCYPQDKSLLKNQSRGRRRIKQGSVIKLNFGKLQQYLNEQHNDSSAAVKGHPVDLTAQVPALTPEQRAHKKTISVSILQNWWKGVKALRESKFVMDGRWSEPQAQLLFALLLGHRVRLLMRSAYIQELVMAQQDIVRVLSGLMNLNMEETAIAARYGSLTDTEQTLVNSLIKELAESKKAFHSALFGGSYWVGHPAPGYWELGEAVSARFRHVVQPTKHTKCRVRRSNSAAAGGTQATPPRHMPIATAIATATATAMSPTSSSPSCGLVESSGTLNANNAPRDIGGVGGPMIRPALSASPDTAARVGVRSASQSTAGPSAGVVLASSTNKRLQQRFAALGPAPVSSSTTAKPSMSVSRSPLVSSLSSPPPITATITPSSISGQKKAESLGRPHIQLDILSGERLAAARKLLSRDTMELQRVSERIPCIKVALWLPVFSATAEVADLTTLKKVHQASKDFKSASLSPQWNTTFTIPLPCPRPAIQALARKDKADCASITKGLLDYWAKGKLSIDIFDGERFSEDLEMGQVNIMLSSFLLHKMRKRGSGSAPGIDCGKPVDMEIKGNFQLEKINPKDRVSGSINLNAYLHLPSAKFLDELQSAGRTGVSGKHVKSKGRAVGSQSVNAVNLEGKHFPLSEQLERTGSANEDALCNNLQLSAWDKASPEEEGAKKIVRASLGRKLFMKTRHKPSPPCQLGSHGVSQMVTAESHVGIENHAQGCENESNSSCEDSTAAADDEDYEDDNDIGSNDLEDSFEDAPSALSYDEDESGAGDSWMRRQKLHQYENTAHQYRLEDSFLDPHTDDQVTIDGLSNSKSTKAAVRAKAARRASIVDITRQLNGLSFDVQTSTDDVLGHFNKKLEAAKEKKLTSPGAKYVRSLPHPVENEYSDNLVSESQYEDDSKVPSAGRHAGHMAAPSVLGGESTTEILLNSSSHVGPAGQPHGPMKGIELRTVAVSKRGPVPMASPPSKSSVRPAPPMRSPNSAAAVVAAYQSATVPILRPKKFTFGVRRCPPPPHLAVAAEHQSQPSASRPEMMARTIDSDNSSRLHYGPEEQSVVSSESDNACPSSSSPRHKENIINISMEGQAAFRAKLSAFLRNQRESHPHSKVYRNAEEGEIPDSILSQSHPLRHSGARKGFSSDNVGGDDDNDDNDEDDDDGDDEHPFGSAPGLRVKIRGDGEAQGSRQSDARLSALNKARQMLSNLDEL